MPRTTPIGGYRFFLRRAPRPYGHGPPDPALELDPARQARAGRRRDGDAVADARRSLRRPAGGTRRLPVRPFPRSGGDRGARRAEALSRGNGDDLAAARAAL